MSNQIYDAKLIAVEINNLLSRYIIIHDQIFKFSWRKIIPLPFLFKPINFKNLNNQLNNILSVIKCYPQQIEDLLVEASDDENNFLKILLARISQINRYKRTEF